MLASPDSAILYPSMQGKSLHQRKDILDAAVSHAVLQPAKVIGASMSCVCSAPLFSLRQTTTTPSPSSEPAPPPLRPPKVCQFACEETSRMWTVFVSQGFPSKFLHLMRHPISSSRSGGMESSVEFIKIEIGRIGSPDDSVQLSSERPAGGGSGSHVFLDFAVFTSQVLSLLLRETDDDETSLLLQLPLSLLPAENFTSVSLGDLQRRVVGSEVAAALDVGPLLPAAGVNYQTNASGLAIAVGGIRTTASLLLKSQRRIRLFLLEDGDGDEEEEDDDEEEGEGEGDSSRTTDVMMSYSREERDGGGGCGEDDDDKENMAD